MNDFWWLYFMLKSICDTKKTHHTSENTLFVVKIFTQEFNLTGININNK